MVTIKIYNTTRRGRDLCREEKKQKRKISCQKNIEYSLIRYCFVTLKLEKTILNRAIFSGA